MAENILVIKHGALGDFVMASGRMRTIRRRHPSAHIALVTEAFLMGLAKSLNLFDEFIEDSRGYRFAVWWRVIKRTIADRKWDVIYDLQSSNRTLCRYYPLALLATGHAMRWGRERPDGMRYRVSTRKIPFLPWFWRNVPERIDWLPVDLSMCHGEKRNFGELPDRYALLIPGCSAGNAQKRWPPDRYRELTRRLAARGLRSVVMGTQAEAAEIDAICDGNPDAVNFRGKSAVADIPALAKGAAVVVGNDTGPSHIAYYAGARLVMVFTDFDFGRAAHPDSPRVASLHGAAITDISTEAVWDALGKVMDHD